MRLIRNKIVQVIRQLHPFAQEYAALPCLSYTHFQPAQPTTVGKRACLWMQDLLIDLCDVERILEEIRFLGVKGATGTQASFLALFEGDHEKVKQLEAFVAKEMGFTRPFSMSRDKLIPANKTSASSPHSPALPLPRISSPPIFAS